MAEAPRILLEHHLKRLKLPTFLREYEKLARQCAAEGLDHVQFLARLVELELIDRERRLVERRIKQARFPVVKQLESFDFKAIPALNKMLVLDLARSEYITRRENVILLGPSGVGKTHVALALALGLAACQKGLSVRFATASHLVHELIEARDEKRLLRLQAQLARVNLLIVDELGYVPLSQTGSELLFDVFSRRYENGVETAGCAELIKDIVARVPGARAGSAVSCDDRFGAKRIRNLRLRPARDTGRRHRHLSEQRGRPGMIARTRVFSRMAAVAAVLLAGLATAVAASAAEIRIEVEDVLGDRGTILVALCDSETYLTGSCPYGGTAPAEDGKVVLTIPDVAPGRYAALVFHDENDNREFDTGASGIPAEGYGFSNDALGQFGPPRYEDAEVTIHEGTNVVRILLVY